MTNARVMIVDDEPTILDLYQLELEDQFAIDTAECGEDALLLLESNGPYAVVVSDMQMPGMSGAEFLREVQIRSPKTIRIMLTGDAKQEVAVEAVNEGQIFRFLNKPCRGSRLAKAIADAVEQHRLLQAEKELLDKTISGSVKVLIDILSMVRPLAFGRATRVKRIVSELCETTAVASSWQIILAAMLSQIGCVTLSDDILEKLHEGAELTAEEKREFEQHPKAGQALIENIPRLEPVARLIAAHQLPYESALDGEYDPEVIERAAFIKVALEYDRLLQQGDLPNAAIVKLASKPKEYSPSVVEALKKYSFHGEEQQEVREVGVHELRVGMRLESDIVSDSGILFVARGQEITELLIQSLIKRSAKIASVIKVSESSSSASADEAKSPAVALS